MQPFWRKSILLRAATQIIGIAVIVGAAFVLLTAYLTEQHTQRNVSRRIAELVTAVETTAQSACFSNDRVLAMEVVNRLAKHSEVLGVVVSGVDTVLAERYKETDGPSPRLLAKAGRIVWPIVSPFDPQQTVGEIVIDPDPEFVRAFVRKNGGLVALLLGLQLLVVVGAVVATVLLLIVRPIKKMSDKLHVMDASSISPLEMPTGHEDTEIGRLVADINQLGQRLVASRDEERQLHLQRQIGERKYHAIFENADSGIFVVNQRMALESCNRAFYRQLHLLRLIHSGKEIILTRLNWRSPEKLRTLMERCAAQNLSMSEDLEYVINERESSWFNVTLTPVGEQLIQGQITDISRHKRAEWSALREAMTDSLTGLLNRNGFLQKIDDEIAVSERGASTPNSAHSADSGFALLLVDLDGFRGINESMGLASGDKILNITASRLRACLKGSDIISRLGGDSFGIILRSASSENMVTSVVMRISHALKGFFEVGNMSLQLGASIGITLFPNDGADRETLLRNAEIALDHVRKEGSARYGFFDLAMARNIEHRRQMENDLRLAVRHNEFRIHFQPIVDLSQRRMSGVEALIRWNHPVQGNVPPDVFVPLAEETGSIVDIGLWMLDAVCHQLAEWKQQGADYHVSLNISARQIPDGLPPITLIETANRYGIDPSDLAIEITESLFMGNSAAAQTWLDAVHDLGFRVYLDDFGTGYSSLSYIKRFPVDVLKIDKSFVRDMAEDNNDRALVEAIINMASSLGLVVVAEGVETQQQLELLEKTGCHCVQGFHFSKPVPAEEIGAADKKIRLMLA